MILSHVKQPESWFGLKYNMNLYRGCEHQCIYCDSRSLCYGIENFADILVKENAIELLRKELASKRFFISAETLRGSAPSGHRGSSPPAAPRAPEDAPAE